MNTTNISWIQNNSIIADTTIKLKDIPQYLTNEGLVCLPKESANNIMLVIMVSWLAIMLLIMAIAVLIKKDVTKKKN